MLTPVGVAPAHHLVPRGVGDRRPRTAPRAARRRAVTADDAARVARRRCPPAASTGRPSVPNRPFCTMLDPLVVWSGASHTVAPYSKCAVPGVERRVAAGPRPWRAGIRSAPSHLAGKATATPSARRDPRPPRPSRRWPPPPGRPTDPPRRRGTPSTPSWSTVSSSKDSHRSACGQVRRRSAAVGAGPRARPSLVARTAAARPARTTTATADSRPRPLPATASARSPAHVAPRTRRSYPNLGMAPATPDRGAAAPLASRPSPSDVDGITT